jgi:uncharacterized protein (DUF58 family)
MAQTSRYFVPERFAKFANLQLLARSVVEGFLSGLHRSPYKGFSVEFAEYREYTAGDDLRHFDWKVWARSDKRYIRQYEEETNLTCHVLLDGSGSMGYGSGVLTKFEYGRYLAAALTYLMVLQRDRVGLTVFDSGIRRRVQPRSSPAHMRHVMDVLESLEAGGRTGIAPALHASAEGLKRRGLVVVISDLIDDPEEVLGALRHFRHDRHEVIVFNLADPAELELPFGGLVEFEDMETGERLHVEPAAVREEYKRRVREFHETYGRECGGAKIDYELVTTALPFEYMLAAYLAKRAAMK